MKTMRMKNMINNLTGDTFRARDCDFQLPDTITNVHIPPHLPIPAETVFDPLTNIPQISQLKVPIVSVPQTVITPAIPQVEVPTIGPNHLIRMIPYESTLCIGVVDTIQTEGLQFDKLEHDATKQWLKKKHSRPRIFNISFVFIG